MPSIFRSEEQAGRRMHSCLDSFCCSKLAKQHAGAAQEKRAKDQSLALKHKLAVRQASTAMTQNIFYTLAEPHVAGPLALLRRARGSTVRVVTRHSRGVRGTATGKALLYLLSSTGTV